MLGSHNSMSYLPIVNWWQRWQKRWCCCQSKTIEEQYALGVRFFDIRLRFIDRTWHFVHNKIDFGPVNYNIFRLLDGQGEPVYIRFILDERKKPKDTVKYVHRYYIFIADILSNYTNIIPYEVLTYWDWKDHKEEMCNRFNIQKVQCSIETLEEMHAGVCNNIVDYILYGTKECRPHMSDVWLNRYSNALNGSNKVLLVDHI